jgi:hippurate hydrolase
MLLPALAVLSLAAAPEAGSLKQAAEALYPQLEALYCDLHQHPELSLQEAKTSAKMAAKLKALGFEVTTNVGGYGVVGLMKNGAGPTVMLRTDMDALPVKEAAEVKCASKEMAKDPAGVMVPVMHACGHDVHMTSWVGAATVLSKMKDKWRGTLMMVGQPAEEGAGGALNMLKAGLFTKFPKPDVALMAHDMSNQASGTVALVPGYALAAVDSINVTFYGRGGHGSAPERTVDPIVISARAILAFQTLVSRENSPFDPAVLTVGSIHGGTKHNIIPDEVKLQLTVRSYREEVRQHILEGIERIAKAEAMAANAPKPPSVERVEGNYATYNEPEIVARLKTALSGALGADKVLEAKPMMAAEDFSEYGRAGVKSAMIWVGGVEPKALDAAKASGTPLPGLHSSSWEPDREPTLKTGVVSLTAAALEFLGKP